VIFQLAGTSPPSELRRALAPRGILVASSGESDGRWVGPLGRVVKAALLSPFVSQRLGTFEAKASAEDLATIAGLVEAGTVTPVIDRTYPLIEVPEAIRYLEEGHARGKVVVTA
jgi:NADPH:quinone reductase-like Zn-dependent oxidoreductase